MTERNNNTKRNKLSDGEESFSTEFLEHSKRAELKEKLIITVAKAIALNVLVGGCMISLCFCAWRSDNISEIIKAMMPVISGVLSFFAGRVTRK